MDFFTILEWIGSIIAVTGTITLVFKLTPFFVTSAIWCVSNVIHGCLFLSTSQYGLFSLQAGLFLIGSIGILNAFFQHKIFHQTLITLFFSSLSVIGVVSLQNITMGWSNTTFFEWAGSMLTLAAGALMSTQGRFKNYAWPLWVASGVFLISLTISTQQWGILSLQSIFFLCNATGLYSHIIKPHVQNLNPKVS